MWESLETRKKEKRKEEMGITAIFQKYCNKNMAEFDEKNKPASGNNTYATKKKRTRCPQNI